jgi:hypothetical protein
MPFLCQVSCNESPPLRDRPRGEEVFERYLGAGLRQPRTLSGDLSAHCSKVERSQHWFGDVDCHLAGLLAQTPAGALIDVTRAKRAIVIAAALLVTCASLSLPWLSTFWPVAISQATAHAAAAVFAPAIAAITLGAVGLKAFPGRIGRNDSFNHARQRISRGCGGYRRLHLGAGCCFLSPGRDVGRERL